MSPHPTRTKHRWSDRSFVLSYLLAFACSWALAWVPVLGLVTLLPAMALALVLDSLAHAVGIGESGSELPSNAAMLTAHAVNALAALLLIRRHPR